MERDNKKIKAEEIATINELAIMMRDAFQDNQDLFVGEINSLRTEMRDGFKKADKNFTEVKNQINNINKNIVDVVRQEEFDKLETQVTDVEEVLDLKLRKS